MYSYFTIGAEQRPLDIKTCVMMTTSNTNFTMVTSLQRLQRLLSCKIYPIVVYDIKIDIPVTFNNSKLFIRRVSTCYMFR